MKTMPNGKNVDSHLIGVPEDRQAQALCNIHPTSAAVRHLGSTNDDQIAETLARLSEATARRIVPFEVATRVGVLPIHGRFDEARRGVMFCVATREFALTQKTSVERILNCDVVVETIPAETLHSAIELAYGFDPDYLPEQRRINSDGAAEDNRLPGVDSLLHKIFCYALLYRASDIHIRESAISKEVMLRVDGNLRPLELDPIDPTTFRALGRFLRVLCGADITKCHLPAEGSCTRLVRGHRFRIRASFLPTSEGSSIVIRILGAPANTIFDLETLGLAPFQIEIVRQALDRERGAIFLCGPTGSGKSTLLATFLKLLTHTRMKIISIEDPVEYCFPEIEQVDLPDFPGMTVDDFLPRFLRQDPDVIVVGETRSQATARTALEAACTGHLVLSTLHAGSVHEALSRLERLLGSELELLDSVHCVVIQRLLPRNCRNCMERQKMPDDIAAALRLADTDSYRGTGCLLCGFTGVSGRIGIYEVHRVVDGTPVPEPERPFHRSVRFHIAQRTISAQSAHGILYDQFSLPSTQSRTIRTKSKPRLLELTQRAE